MHDGLDQVKSGGRDILDSDLDRLSRRSGPGEGSTSGEGNIRGCERCRRDQTTGFRERLMELL